MSFGVFLPCLFFSLEAYPNRAAADFPIPTKYDLYLHNRNSQLNKKQFLFKNKYEHSDEKKGSFHYEFTNKTNSREKKSFPAARFRWRCARHKCTVAFIICSFFVVKRFKQRKKSLERAGISSAHDPTKRDSNDNLQ